MTDLLDLSRRMIDEDGGPGAGSEGGFGAANRITLELSEVADGVAVVESFSHVVAFDSGAGLVLFDTSLGPFGPAVVGALRGWRTDPVDTLVYTHGHVDHVGGAQAVLDDADERGYRRPAVVAHEAVPDRFDRYDLTHGYNSVINQRQFGGTGLTGGRDDAIGFPRRWVRPTVTYRDRLHMRVGDLDLALHHTRGETDDHTWTWIPSHRAACIGDLMVWVFPNAGNPQKVQRYASDWAASLQQMAGLGAEVLLAGHGLPIFGADRVRAALTDTADLLASLEAQTLMLMNTGCSLDRVLHEVEVPAHLRDKPYLRPVYDHPQFIVRNVWRRYGGWYDGEPDNLLPAPRADQAREWVQLAGGVERVLARARELADQGDLRLACHLVEHAVIAAPNTKEAHETRAHIYEKRAMEQESSMARNLMRHAAEASKQGKRDLAGDW
jgi:alkyl sulfatase BDS1-like metallo-beta-lactamase superfamily hydrolase